MPEKQPISSGSENTINDSNQIFNIPPIPPLPTPPIPFTDHPSSPTDTNTPLYVSVGPNSLYPIHLTDSQREQVRNDSSSIASIITPNQLQNQQQPIRVNLPPRKQTVSTPPPQNQAVSTALQQQQITQTSLRLPNTKHVQQQPQAQQRQPNSRQLQGTPTQPVALNVNANAQPQNRNKIKNGDQAYQLVAEAITKLPDFKEKDYFFIRTGTKGKKAPPKWQFLVLCYDTQKQAYYPIKVFKFKNTTGDKIELEAIDPQDRITTKYDTTSSYWKIERKHKNASVTLVQLMGDNPFVWDGNNKDDNNNKDGGRLFIKLEAVKKLAELAETEQSKCFIKLNKQDGFSLKKSLVLFDKYEYLLWPKAKRPSSLQLPNIDINAHVKGLRESLNSPLYTTTTSTPSLTEDAELEAILASLPEEGSTNTTATTTTNTPTQTASINSNRNMRPAEERSTNTAATTTTNTSTNSNRNMQPDEENSLVPTNKISKEIKNGFTAALGQLQQFFKEQKEQMEAQNKENAENFKKLGEQTKETNKTLKDINNTLQELSDNLGNISLNSENETNKTSKANRPKIILNKNRPQKTTSNSNSNLNFFSKKRTQDKPEKEKNKTPSKKQKQSEHLGSTFDDGVRRSARHLNKPQGPG